MMGLRFRKSINLGRGVHLNISKSGVGMSFGNKYNRTSISPKGQVRNTTSLPGTGLSYTKQKSLKKGK